MIHTLNLTEHATKTTIKFSVETVSPSRLLLKTGKTNSLIFSQIGEKIFRSYINPQRIINKDSSCSGYCTE